MNWYFSFSLFFFLFGFFYFISRWWISWTHSFFHILHDIRDVAGPTSLRSSLLKRLQNFKHWFAINMIQFRTSIRSGNFGRTRRAWTTNLIKKNLFSVSYISSFVLQVPPKSPSPHQWQSAFSKQGRQPREEQSCATMHKTIVNTKLTIRNIGFKQKVVSMSLKLQKKKILAYKQMQLFTIAFCLLFVCSLTDNNNRIDLDDPRNWLNCENLEEHLEIENQLNEKLYGGKRKSDW